MATGKKGLLLTAAFTALGLAGMKSIFGEGEGLIRGIANSGNNFYIDPVANKLPGLMAASSSVPPVSDEELAATYAAVRARAQEGDLEAAAILFKLAELQRQEP